MPLVTLAISEFKRVLVTFFWVSLAISTLFVLGRHYLLGASIWASLTSVTLAVGLSGWLTFFILRRPMAGARLPWLLRRRQIHGVWFGELRSNYNVASGAHDLVIPVGFVIRQTYLGYSLVSYTKRQEGYSFNESLVEDARNGLFLVRYSFEMRRTWAAENKLTRGQGELRLEKAGTRLAGSYWTNSPTQGDAELDLVQRDCTDVDSFAEVERLFEMKRSPHVADASAVA